MIAHQHSLNCQHMNTYCLDNFVHYCSGSPQYSQLKIGYSHYLIQTFKIDWKNIVLSLVSCTKDHHCADGQACLNTNVCTCSQDADCASTETCQNGECQEVTCDSLSCGTNAQCVVAQNEAVCECNSGFYAITTPDAGCGKLYIYWLFLLFYSCNIIKFLSLLTFSSWVHRGCSMF